MAFKTYLVSLLTGLFLHCGPMEDQLQKAPINEITTSHELCLSSPVIVLTYHAINDVNNHPETRRVSDFTHDLDFLIAQGYAFDTLEGLKDKIEQHQDVKPTIILNFDDGLSEHFMAAQELSTRHLPGNFFVSTFPVDSPDYLTWTQIDQMVQMGASIDSHNYHHEMMGVKHDGETDAEYYARVYFEMHQAKLDFEAHGITTTTYALPGGSGINDPKVIQAAIDAGYTIIRGVGKSVERFIPGKTVKNLHYMSMYTTTHIEDVTEMMKQNGCE